MNKLYGNIRGLMLVGFISFLVMSESRSQDLENDTNWDNLIYFGNKVTWGSNKWRNSGELQVRLQDSYRQLFQWHLEYVGSYLLNKNIELVPDFRATVKPDRYEFRPGFGVVVKNNLDRGQFVHQIKGQVDFKTGGGETTQVIRYFPSYNHFVSEKWIASVVVGSYFKFTDEKSGLELLMAGANAAYVINKQHTLNLTYVYGAQKQFPTDEYLQFGILMCRLIINIQKDYEYLPAKYINF